MQQFCAEFSGCLVPQLAGALRKLHITCPFGIGNAVDARAAGVAAMVVRRREAIESDH